MKISTEIGSASRIIGEEKSIELYAKAGFNYWDFSMILAFEYNWQTNVAVKRDHPLQSKNAVEFARRLKRVGEDNGIYCNQSHAPFPIKNKQIADYMKTAIECTAEAGGEICVIHPDNNKTPEQNAEFYHTLLPFAKECGVKIATENMWNWDDEKNCAFAAACSHHDDFVKHIDVVNDENFVACLDIGHAEMRGLDTSAEIMIYALGHRLKALHIHDNDRWHDSHQIPFSMDIDFSGIIKALKNIHYDGIFTLEADAYLQEYKNDMFLGITNLANSAKKLVEMYNKI